MPAHGACRAVLVPVIVATPPSTVVARRPQAPLLVARLTVGVPVRREPVLEVGLRVGTPPPELGRRRGRAVRTGLARAAAVECAAVAGVLIGGTGVGAAVRVPAAATIIATSSAAALNP